jgi:hypothetical protein
MIASGDALWAELAILVSSTGQARAFFSISLMRLSLRVIRRPDGADRDRRQGGCA